MDGWMDGWAGSRGKKSCKRATSSRVHKHKGQLTSLPTVL